MGNLLRQDSHGLESDGGEPPRPQSDRCGGGAAAAQKEDRPGLARSQGRRDRPIFRGLSARRRVDAQSSGVKVLMLLRTRSSVGLPNEEPPWILPIAPARSKA